jgi:hypothetical protein
MEAFVGFDSSMIEEPGEAMCMTLPYCLAVPTRAFRIGLVEHSLISRTRPGELIVQSRFGDFVIVIDQCAISLHRISHVSGWGKLVGMPCQIYIQGWYRHLAFVPHDEHHEALVFDHDPFSGCFDCRRMKPVDLVHLRNERALPDDRAHQIQGEGGAIVPVPRHHPPDSDFLQPPHRSSSTFLK